MDVASLCPVCHRPGVLQTCPLCGLTAHRHCLAAATHAHGAPPAGPGTGDLLPPKT